MHFIMNLDWGHFAISEQVREANQIMRELTVSLGVDQKIIFNCAALGTGEKLLPFANGALGNNAMPSDTLEHLRREHQKIRAVLAQNAQFRSNRNLTEMLNSLRRAGHELVAVSDTVTGELEAKLDDSRLHDYFGDNVYGHDRRPKNLSGGFNMLNLLTAAVQDTKGEYKNTLIVADNPDTIRGGVVLKPRAVVGYLDPIIPFDEQEIRLKELSAAGASFAVVGGHYVANLPEFLNIKEKYEPDIAALLEQLEDVHEELAAQPSGVLHNHLH